MNKDLKMNKEKLVESWQKAIEIDVVDKKSALLFREKTKEFLSFYECYVYQENKVGIPMMSRKIPIKEKDFFQRWVVSDGKALFFIEGSKTIPEDEKEKLSFFNDYKDFIELWEKVATAYLNGLTKIDIKEDISPAFEVSFLGFYFENVTLNNSIEDYFFDSRFEGEQNKTSIFGFRKSHFSSSDSEKVKAWEDMPFSIYKALDEQKKSPSMYSINNLSYGSRIFPPSFCFLELYEKEKLLAEFKNEKSNFKEKNSQFRF